MSINVEWGFYVYTFGQLSSSRVYMKRKALSVRGPTGRHLLIGTRINLRPSLESSNSFGSETENLTRADLRNGS